MSTPLLVRGARQLLTVRGGRGPRRGPALGDLAIIEDGAVLVRNGVIEALGPTRRIENLAEARRAVEIDATRCVVAPGFVDSHTHLICGPPRLEDFEMRLAGAGYHDIARAGGGIPYTVREVRQIPIRRLVMEGRRVIGQFVRNGTTTAEAKSGYALDESGERKILRAIQALGGKPIDLMPTYLGAHMVPPEFAGRADDYVDWMCTHMLPKLHRRQLARFVDVFCDEHAFTVEQSRRYLDAAQSLGFLLKVHAGQFSESTALNLAVEFGAVSADHLDYISPEQIRLLAGSHTMAALLPGAVFFLGLDHYAPARRMIEEGVAVALASDFNPGTSPTCSMPMILSLACSRMGMTPAEAFAAATINAAHALCCDQHTGSIEAGKDADLVIFDTPDYREVPYHFGVNLVRMVIKRGVVLYRQGELRWQDGSLSACPTFPKDETRTG